MNSSLTVKNVSLVFASMLISASSFAATTYTCLDDQNTQLLIEVGQGQILGGVPVGPAITISQNDLSFTNSLVGVDDQGLGSATFQKVLNPGIFFGIQRETKTFSIDKSILRQETSGAAVYQYHLGGVPGGNKDEDVTQSFSCKAGSGN